MSKVIINHEVFGPVLLDTETQTYEYIEHNNEVMFNKDDKKVAFFNSGLEFINSGINMGVIPMVCVEHKLHKRRTYIELIDINNYTYTFFNVEMIDSRWVENKIDKFIKGRCYFVLLLSDIKAMNDFRLLSQMEIKKGVYGNTLL